MRRFLPVIILGLVLVTLATVFATQVQFGEHVPEKLPEFAVAPEFELTRQDGRKFSSTELRNKVYLLNFFFTSCPAVCPAIMSRMAKLHAVFKDDPRVEFVSISIDPETDTPAVLAAYGEKYGVKRNSWVLLSGPEETVKKLRAEQLKIDDGTDKEMHTVRVTLVDTHGTIRGFYRGNEDDDMKRLNRDMMLLLE